MRSVHPTQPTRLHGPNSCHGRDLVVGDVHGEFHTLEHALKSLEFRPAKDRLFTLGDLIDRGPRSADAFDWLEHGRFAGGVRGNHEQMMAMVLVEEADPFVRTKGGASALWTLFGNDWWYESQEAEHARRDEGPPSTLPARWLHAISTMPYITTIDYGDRRVGLVHSAGATETWIHWDRLCEWVENVCADDHAPHRLGVETLNVHLLWPDEMRWGLSADDPSLREPIPDVDLVLTGHTPGHFPRWARPNVVNIDTGAHDDEYGHLTIAEIQNGLELHQFARTERFE